jgi:hypothetical protein
MPLECSLLLHKFMNIREGTEDNNRNPPNLCNENLTNFSSFAKFAVKAGEALCHRPCIEE